MENISKIRNRVDMLEEEIRDVKKVLITLHPVNIKKNKTAWKQLVKAGKKISKEWKGKDAVEEIRGQRTK